MKYIICLHLDDNVGITASRYNDCCYVDLNLKPNMDFEKAISKKNLIKMLKKELLSGCELYPERLGLIKDILSLNFDLFEESEFINIDYQEGIKEYLDKNPGLKCKELHLDHKFNANTEDLNMILDYFKDHKDILVNIDGNDASISLEDYEKTVGMINEIVDKIKQYNFSPLEQIMFAYDITRDRVYTKENEEENYNTSRDLTSVLFGDKIVCVGYTNVFDKILKNLGIKSMPYTLLNEKTGVGHMRDLVYVNDPKYKVEGLFFFDPTWDSKKENNNDYLMKYNYFCKKKNYMDQKRKMKDLEFGDYNECTCWDFADIVDEKGVRYIPIEMIKNFNKIARFVDDKTLINQLLIRPEVPEFLKSSIIDNMDINSIKNDVIRYKDLFYEGYLKPDILLKVLYNVRKIEYYENPEKYPFNVEVMRKVVNNDRKINKILSILLYGEYCEMDDKEFEEFNKSTELDKNIERVKVAKTLRRVLEKKSLES